MTNSITIQQKIDRVIAYIDRVICKQLTIILHHAQFQQLEASWRGIDYLTKQSSEYGHQRVKIKLLSITAKEVEKDLMSAIEFDQSQLFLKIYSNEFDIPGGEPFGLIIGDYYVNHRIARSDNNILSIQALKLISHIAAAAFSPFVAAVHAGFFGLNDYSEMPAHLDLDKLFQHNEYYAWKKFRESDDARFIGLTLPRVLMRSAYKHYPIEPYLHYTEQTRVGTSLWGNPSYCYAAVVIRSFARTSWLADISGLLPGKLAGGIVTGIQSATAEQSEHTGFMPRFGLEYMITDRREKLFTHFGLLPLCHCKYSNYGVFYSSYSIKKIQSYNNKQVEQNANLSIMLHYILCVSRFAHYIKLLVRDKIGSFSSPEQCEKILTAWILQYAAAGNDLDEEIKAKKPLKSASVSVLQKKGKPGSFHCTINLQPHYQIEQMESHMQLVTELKVAC